MPPSAVRRARSERNSSRGTMREHFELLDCPAPEISDLLRLFRRHRPVLVYFAGGQVPAGARRPGHALFGPADGLYVHRNGAPSSSRRRGSRRSSGRRALGQAHGAASRSVKLMVLDRLFAKLQVEGGEALLEHVPCVVGASSAASPEVAENYAAGLFGAIGDGESLATACRHGCAADRRPPPPRSGARSARWPRLSCASTKVGPPTVGGVGREQGYERLRCERHDEVHPPRVARAATRPARLQVAWRGRRARQGGWVASY
jgi:hypothetical protein